MQVRSWNTRQGLRNGFILPYEPLSLSASTAILLSQLPFLWCSTTITLGPVLFVHYTAYLSTVIEKHSTLHHSYASGPQHLKSNLRSPPLQAKMHYYVKTWMTANKLKLNDDKTKEMITSSGRKSRSLSSSFPDSMSIGSASVPVNAVPLLALVTMFD